MPDPIIDRIVIIGAGQAWVGAAAELRRLGFARSITIVSEDLHAPYRHPPLPKELVTGGISLTLSAMHRIADSGVRLR